MSQVYITAMRVPADSSFASVAAQDYYRVRQELCRAFRSKEEIKAARILFRFDIEGEVGWLYVQTRTEPNWAHLSRELALDIHGPVPLQIPADERLRFRLLARPTRRVGKKGSPIQGMRRSILEESVQKCWLLRKAEEHGFAVEACVLTCRSWIDTKNNHTLPNGSPKPISGTQFDGILRVTNRAAFVRAIERGIGTGKAFGFGLLSVARLG